MDADLTNTARQHWNPYRASSGTEQSACWSNALAGKASEYQARSARSGPVSVWQSTLPFLEREESTFASNPLRGG
jgi:hypothetical protein